MTSLYTRQGDDGTSRLADGRRLPKDHPRFELLGCLDEVNCLIGAAKHPIIDNEVSDALEFVQHRLLNCGSLVAGTAASAGPGVTTGDVEALERAIDRFTERAGGFSGFVLPGGDESSAPLHVARAVMRRTERAAARLSAVEEIDPVVLAFLNRAGDLLYAAARVVSAGNEVEWRADLDPPAL